MNHILEILSRNKGQTKKYIDTLVESLNANKSVIIPTTSDAIIKRYWKLVKNRGIDVGYDKIFTAQRPRLFYDEVGEVRDIEVLPKKHTGYIMYIQQ